MLRDDMLYLSGLFFSAESRFLNVPASGGHDGHGAEVPAPVC